VAVLSFSDGTRKAPKRHRDGTTKAPDKRKGLPGAIRYFPFRSARLPLSSSIHPPNPEIFILVCLSSTLESPSRFQGDSPFFYHLRRILAGGRNSGIFPHFNRTGIAPFCRLNALISLKLR
jgi:hypothetical protein